MRNKFKIFYLILIVIISSCEIEESEMFNNKAGLLYQVDYNSECYYEYKYNGANQIIEEKSKLHYTKHNYKDNKLISSDYYLDPGMYSSNSYVVESAMNRKEWVNPTNTEKNSTKKYFYDNYGKLIKSSNNLNICEFSYDNGGRIIRQTFYSDNRETGYIDYLYDEKDNIIKRLHYWILNSGQAELQTTTEYEFDNKLNPYKAFYSLMIPGVYTNTNNIIKETYAIHFEIDQSIEKVQVTENSYKYNSQGYPISKNDFETYKYY